LPLVFIVELVASSSVLKKIYTTKINKIYKIVNIIELIIQKHLPLFQNLHYFCKKVTIS
jgi:hypothetical protein